MATASRTDRHIPATLPLMVRVGYALLRMVRHWETRRQTRRDLARLPRHLLDDIGLTPRLADCECHKPFWRG
jgi:uncharacterized protein YjiS (DUF1127 family)